MVNRLEGILGVITALKGHEERADSKIVYDKSRICISSSAYQPTSGKGNDYKNHDFCDCGNDCADCDCVCSDCDCSGDFCDNC